MYVEKKPGVFEMREVKLGVRGETYVEVLSGIRKGERVVTSGNFPHRLREPAPAQGREAEDISIDMEQADHVGVNDGNAVASVQK